MDNSPGKSVASWFDDSKTLSRLEMKYHFSFVNLPTMRQSLLNILPFASLAFCNEPSTTPPPQFTIPCVVGNNEPCPTSWTCTPTETCTFGHPCGGLCFTPPPVVSVPIIPCTMGGNCHCPSGSTCTPTMYSTPDKPWGGQCIATTPPSTSSLHRCAVGGKHQCSKGSACTATMPCSKGHHCGGLCIATSYPVTRTNGHSMHHGE